MILVACLAWVLVKVLQIHKWHKWLNRKPFACETCLAGWLAIPYCWHEWRTPLYMAGAMVLVIFLNEIMKPDENFGFRR